MVFMVFMLFGAFDVVVQRPRRPDDHIDCIISSCPPINGTWHIRSAASSGTAARHRQPPLRLRRRLSRSLCRRWRRSRYNSIIVAPAAASLSFSSLSMTKMIRIHSICACSSVFVVLFIVDDEDDTIQPCCAFSSVFVVRSVVDDDEADTIQSCWQPTWSSFHRIAAVGRSTPIAIYILTLIVIGSALVIHRAFTLILSDVPPYAFLWVW